MYCTVEYCGYWQPPADSKVLAPPTDDPNCLWGVRRLRGNGAGFCKGDAMRTTRQTSIKDNFEDAPGTEFSAVTTDCRFTSIDWAYNKAELQCFTGFWGGYSRPPSYTRLNMTQSATSKCSLVVECNTHSSVLSDGDMAVSTTVVLSLWDRGQGDSMENGPRANYPDTMLSWNLRFTAYTICTQDNSSSQEVTEMVLTWLA